MLSLVDAVIVQRNRPRDHSRDGKRQKTNIYSFLVNGKKVTICRTMFLNTLSVSEQFVKTAHLKGGNTGLVVGDQRGKHSPANKSDESMIDDVKKHIGKYPAYCSHYSREKTEKKYLGFHLNVFIMYRNYADECKARARAACKICLFRKIFNEEFNLSFKQPNIDTCDTCDAYECN